MHLRSQHKTLMARLSEPPRNIIVVTGPGYVGKTKFVRDTLEHLWSLPDGVGKPAFHACCEPVRVHWQKPDGSKLNQVISPDVSWLVDVWEEARREAMKPNRPVPHILVLDDIHVIGQWERVVRTLWDVDRMNQVPLHIVLIPSDPLMALEGLQILAGRCETLPLSHWSYQEMKALCNLSLHQYLYYGGYPCLKDWLSDDDTERWPVYVNDNFVKHGIGSDSTMMQQVEFPFLMQVIYESFCEFSGQIVSKRDLCWELSESSMMQCMELLGKMGRVRGLENYGKDAELSPDLKLQVMNTALIPAAKGYTFAEVQADSSIQGQLAESAVGAHLLNAGNSHTRVFYWQEGDHEVDFVVERGSNRLAIEVESFAKQASTDRGLEAFIKNFPGSRQLVLGASGIPLEQFLSSGPDHWFELAS